ncbi:MAG: putative porin [Balneolaceae bacterium]
MMLLNIITAGLLLFQVQTSDPEGGQPGDPEISEPDTTEAAADTVSVPERIDPEGEEDEEEELVPISIWEVQQPPGYLVAETDSTLRWFMALDWTEQLSRNPGVIAYRTGSLGRPAGLDIHSFENRHQRVEIENLSANDPVTGQVHWGRVPIHKIESIAISDRSGYHSASVRLREHYLVQPRTYLNFDESRDNYRSLEFAFIQNLTSRLNLELSYWDRKDGTLYTRNNMEGNQIVAKGRYHLSEELMVKAGYVTNTLNQEEPFGYSIADLRQYHFNPYSTGAVRSSASSARSMSDLYLQLYQRRGEEDPAGRMVGLSLQGDGWDLKSSSDSVRYNMNRLTLQAWQDLEVGPARFRFYANGESLQDNEQETLTEHRWFRWNIGLKGELSITDVAGIGFTGDYRGRSDSRTGYELSGYLSLRPVRPVELRGYGGITSSIPELQALYWNSEEWQGDRQLLNEEAFFSGLSATLGIGSALTLGVRADLRQVEQGIFVNPDGLFQNIDPYTNLSGTAWAEFDSERFEGLFSVSSQAFSSGSGLEMNRNLNGGGERVWIKGALYWKNYLFDRALFLTAGISGMYSPGEYHSASWLPELNRWQHGHALQAIPSFYRLDTEVSARVRWMMVLVRWENSLDRIDQLGYFETEGYPMPYRRMIFGLRVLFTN